MGVIQCIFSFMECLVGGNIPAYISDNHILFYDMDEHISIMLGYSYFTFPDYLIAQGWVTAMILHKTNIILAVPNVHHFLSPFLRLLGTFILITL